MKLGYLPNPAAPESYHELVLWRKIFDRNPLFVTLTDKLAAKAHISSACPELALPRTLWSGRDAIDIPLNLLAGDVVVKTNHGCAMNISVAGGDPNRGFIVAKDAAELAEKTLRSSRWRMGHWPVVPTVFVEAATGALRRQDRDRHQSACLRRRGNACRVEDKGSGAWLLLDQARTPSITRARSGYPARIRRCPSMRGFSTMSVRRYRSPLSSPATSTTSASTSGHRSSPQLAGEIVVLSRRPRYGTTTNPAFAGEIERLWRLEQSHYLRGAQGDQPPLRRRAPRQIPDPYRPIPPG